MPISDSRYQRVLVILHWLQAALILNELVGGFVVLEPTPNADPQKINALKSHMGGGMLILALTVLRFVVRLATSHPAAARLGLP